LTVIRIAKIPQHFILTFLNSSPGYLEKIQLFVFSPKNLKGANDFSIPLTQCCCFFCCGRLIIHSFFNFFFGGRWLGKFAFLDNGRAVNFFLSVFVLPDFFHPPAFRSKLGNLLLPSHTSRHKNVLIEVLFNKSRAYFLWAWLLGGGCGLKVT